MKLFKFLFTLEGPVNRKQYIFWGLLLMALKYAVEAYIAKEILGTWMTPVDYLNPFSNYRVRLASQGVGDSWWVYPMIWVWSLPFICIGVGMSIRRSVDANLSPWYAMQFFIPYWNYVMIFFLSIMPSRHVGLEKSKEHLRVVSANIYTGFVIAMISLGVGFLMVTGSVFRLESYGLALFIGVPFVMGTLSGYYFNFQHIKGLGQTLAMVCVPMVGLGLLLLITTLEGLVCLGMATPIAMPMVLLGGYVGRCMASWRPKNVKLNSVIILALFPMMVTVEKVAPPTIPLREVLTVAEINAPPEKVWPIVVEFPDLKPATEWYFRMGVAHPLRARIEGNGVGAIRYCQFSTGDFVEPITHWEAPSRLAFSVKYQPHPMKELTIYEQVHAPHLDNYVRSEKGEFRLIPLPGGRTRIEGRTWYRVNIHPAQYWSGYSDYFIHKIHERVLAHIREVAEKSSI